MTLSHNLLFKHSRLLALHELPWLLLYLLIHEELRHLIQDLLLECRVIARF